MVEFEIINIEFIGEDGKRVICYFNDGSSAIVDSDNPKVKEFQDKKEKK